MSLRRFCDRCESYIPSGSEYIQLTITETSGRIVSIKEWDEACTVSANGYLDETLYGIKGGLITEIRLRRERAA